MTAPRRWLDVKEAAEYCAVSFRTMQRWTGERRIPSVQVGGVVRYDARDPDAYMEKNKRPAYAGTRS